MKETSRERVEHEMKVCKRLETSWQKRADQCYGKQEKEKEYIQAVNRSEVYGIMAIRLEKVLEQWEGD